MLSDCSTDFGHAVADADDGGLAGCVEIATSRGVDNPAAFAANGDWKLFAEIAREKRGIVRHGDAEIVAERGWRRRDRLARFRDTELRPTARVEYTLSGKPTTKIGADDWAMEPGGADAEHDDRR